MVKRAIKPSDNPIEIAKKNKETNYTFGFQYFHLESTKDTTVEFNNNYSSEVHFIKIISDLMDSLKTLSTKNYNNTIVTKELEHVMHFKEFSNDNANTRIKELLIKVFNNNAQVVKELNEGSTFIEFGKIDDSRYVGALIDYHIIELLYIDPHHLTFPDTRFNISQKMSYSFPSPLEQHRSSSTKLFGNSSQLYDEINTTYMNQQNKNKLELYEMITNELKTGKMSNETAINFLKEMGEEKYEK